MALDGFFTQPVMGLGNMPHVMWMTLAPNGTSNPLTANSTGPRPLRAATAVYAATGQLTITFPADVVFPSYAVFLVSAQPADLTNWFEVCTIGAYNPTTRQLVVQMHRAGTGYAPAAAAGCRIHIGIAFANSGA